MSAYMSYNTGGIFIDPMTDPGFKILFGRESSKDVLISLLNTILEEDLGECISDLYYTDKEKVRQSAAERTMLYDIHCTTSSGKRFIVEMQTLPQEWFVERVLLYAARAITEQSVPGPLNFYYEPVISIAFVNFTIPRFDGQPVADGVPTDRYTGKPITDRLRLIFIQLPQFTQSSPEECDTVLKEWVYTIKNMKNMESIPFATKNPIFKRVEELARKENMSPEERREYERNEKAYRDYFNQMQYASTTYLQEGFNRGIKQGIEQGVKQGIEQGVKQGIEQGVKQGIEQGVKQGIDKGRSEEKILIARNMIRTGLAAEQIAICTGLSETEIRNIARELG